MANFWLPLTLVLAAHVLLTWGLAVFRARNARRRPAPDWRLVETPRVSVLIPAWNERAVLAETLAALRRSDYPNWEAIVVAGGADGTFEFARQLYASLEEFTVVEQLPRGKNAALALGLERAKGEVIVLLDADTHPEPEWLSALVAPLQHGFAASTANYQPAFVSWVSQYFEMEKISAYQVHHIPTLNGCGGIAITRAALQKIGGFPETVAAGVDWDMNERLAQNNLPRCFAPAARAATALPHTLAGFWTNQLRWRRAHLQSIFRHFTPRLLTGLVFYGMSLVFLVTPVLALVLGWQTWPLLWGWMLLRRMATAIECAVYTADTTWLRRAWIPPALLVVDFAAAIFALLTAQRRDLFFKGFRPKTG